MARPAQAASDATSDATSGTVAGAASGTASGTAADNASGAASGAAAKKAAPAARVHGHDLLTRLLPDIAGHVARGTVVEIGSTREKLEGQGSTVILATLAAQLGLPFVTVDMDPANTEQARTDLARLGGARAVTDRGENFLAKFEGPIVAAYLDAFDIQHGHHSDYRVERYRQFLGTEITNTASSAMHLACAEALLPRLVPGGLIVIDDTWLDAGAWTGKGSTAVPALLAAGFYIVGRAKTAIALRSGLGA